MSFSQITRTHRASGGSISDLLDPLVEAWTLVRQVRQVEYESERTRNWTRAIQALASAAERSLRDHTARCSESLSIISGLAGRADEAGTMARRHQEDERRTLDCARAFVSLCQRRDPADIWRVVEVTEAAIELEMAIARNHNQVAALWDRGLVYQGVAS